MLEIVKLTGNEPLVLEVQVPPLCFPFLVGNPKGEGLLTWVEKASPKETIFTWGVEATPEKIIEEMLKIALNRSSLEGWGIQQPSFQLAEKRLHDLGIEEITTSGKIIHPKDPSLLGTLIVGGKKCFPIIHNISRGLCVIGGV